jgi:hypothetical protein
MPRFLSHQLFLPALATLALFVSPRNVRAEELSGTISQTVTITENSELVGDVSCAVPTGTPCIHFGSSNIKLMLNGFTITGQAEPPAGCTSAKDFLPEDGIAIVALHDVAVFGPGRVQKFGRMGILLSGATRTRIQGVTTSDNCFSGIFLAGTTDSDIEGNVSVRNAIGSNNFPCGGT